MKKVIYLSLAVIATLQAEEILEDISITELGTTQIVKNISGEELKSADLAEALHKNVPSISIIRRSGIANDILLRGQKRDNINVTIDGAKVHGACPNRMDPPTSHVVTHAIEDVVVQEGPFDVEEFGVLSGSVKVKTKQPTKEVHGDISLNAGSFDYKKASGTISGGTDKVRFLFSASTEEGGQYEDGKGRDFSEQLQDYTASTPAPTDPTKDDARFNYSTANKGKDAFEKNMYMGKVFVDFSPDQALEFSYTANRSDNVLYPSTPMDALYDDSDIFNLQYSLKNLSPYSKELNVQAYNSKVDHPMSTKFRNAGQMMYMTHALTTEATGLKVKNAVDAFGQNIVYGVDGSKRNWDGAYNMTTVATGATNTTRKSINDVDTQNIGVFIKSKKALGQLTLEMGARYDDTSIETASLTSKNNDYEALSANIFANYQVNDNTKYFAGVGKSSRVPDARELYFVNKTGGITGNENLNQTTNYELDFGVEKQYDNGAIKAKTFYSKLKDYIYYNGSQTNTNFENIDATIYGLELSSSYMPRDDVYLSAGAVYKKGKKDTQPTGQTNTNLADITPLKLNATAAYDYDENGMVEVSIVAADKWDTIDSDNNEQTLAGYGVVNLKTTRNFDNGLAFTLGLDNAFDKAYANTNTYNDLVLISGGDTMLINEPGRYVYLNAKYQF
ncbi:MAG: TonB-dependent receptor [uncultured Sulfurovum sp.]|uniref:TonB-dependent receptor n=1 Tax=uncultured Sulfurovum sp. TaxID=269237 RepID=A0A6S6TSS7_9BACT|nr:MAG: TonB-dependent receptor [uncultured Sulfurovum sp.]